MAKTDRDDLITAETALVMAMMNMGEAATNTATYRAHGEHLGGLLSAQVYREHALEEIAKVRAALDKAAGILAAYAPKKVAA